MSNGDVEDEEEWEYEEDEVDDKANTKADIKIEGNLITIDRSKVDWSDDEFEEEASPPPAPPPPPPPVPPPPPPPPGPAAPKASSGGRADKLDQLKKRPTKRPDWNDLMQEIEKFRCSHGLLNRVQCDDRSRPILTKTKVKDNFVYDSEKELKNADILNEIKGGHKLRHVKCNDRSKPNLKGIRQFKRQLTKEEKLAQPGVSLTEELLDDFVESEDVHKLKDDLESTKQLLELEVRSKQLLERDNKKMQNEIEKLRMEMEKFRTGTGTIDEAPSRKESIHERKKSLIRLTSESGSQNTDTVEILTEIEKSEMRGPRATDQFKHSAQEELEEMEELKEEADEARRLAEEWENKYKEMQRQMEDMDKGHTEKAATEITNGEQEELTGSSSDEDWVTKRELHQLQIKLRNGRDKKEVIVKERNLLNERLDNLKEGIAKEIESRILLKKEVKEMNAAFTAEMAEMEAMEELGKDLEDCYFSDDELVENTNKKKKNPEDEDDDEEDDEEEEGEEEEVTVDDILKSADDMMSEEQDRGFEYFNTEGVMFEDTSSTDKDEIQSSIDKQAEVLQLMRKSNFLLKSKIDILSDALQLQREKHHDLKQELNRMLTDIQ